jgi:hypothetical protein
LIDLNWEGGIKICSPYSKNVRKIHLKMGANQKREKNPVFESL